MTEVHCPRKGAGENEQREGQRNLYEEVWERPLKETGFAPGLRPVPSHAPRTAPL